MKALKLQRITRHFGYILLGVVIRLLGISTLIIGVLLMFAPYTLIFLLLGIDNANVTMSYVMRLPMNWTFGEGMGDSLLEVHRDIEKGVF